jgi:hypothetical protein
MLQCWLYWRMSPMSWLAAGETFFFSRSSMALKYRLLFCWSYVILYHHMLENHEDRGVDFHQITFSTDGNCWLPDSSAHCQISIHLWNFDLEYVLTLQHLSHWYVCTDNLCSCRRNNIFVIPCYWICLADLKLFSDSIIFGIAFLV